MSSAKTMTEENKLPTRITPASTVVMANRLYMGIAAHSRPEGAPNGLLLFGIDTGDLFDVLTLNYVWFTPPPLIILTDEFMALANFHLGTTG